jgi:N-methylhydantoinase B
VLANYATAAAESMAYTLMRTAHSTFIKETQDFSCGLLTPEGATFASPVGMGSTWFVGLHYGPVISAIDSYQEGDICITNDAYSGHVATHTPDMHVWKPVFHQGELICFAAGHVHNTDMGGAVPASLSRSLTEIQQEGVRIRPTRLMRAGVIDPAVADFLGLNVRSPEQNWGDLKAQIASVNVGERKIHEMISRFGVDTVKRGMDGLLDHAERQARATLAKIPDGEYIFSDFADEDAPQGLPCRIHVALHLAGGEATLDFTGSDPQLQSSLNIPTGGREHHALMLVIIGYVLYTLDPRQLLNFGTLRPVRCVLPEGTVVNPHPPAAIGMRSLTCATVMSAMLGAFHQALPEKIPAAPAGALSVLNLRTTDARGEVVMASLGPVGGGAGGFASHDGAEGSGANFGFLRNMPIELIESEIPVEMLEYGLAPDSGGAGRHRGGSAVTMRFRVGTPNSVVTARNRDRSRFVPWGVRGGRPGAPSSFVLNPGTPGERNLENCDLLPVDPGDIVRVTGPGGGGYGVPWERPAGEVARDVRLGHVSAEQARRLYGVACGAAGIDEGETTRLRASLATDAPPRNFTFGSCREAWEARITPAHYEILTRLLAAAPLAWRHFLKQRILRALRDAPRDEPPGRVAELYEALRRDYQVLPPLPSLDVSTPP